MKSVEMTSDQIKNCIIFLNRTSLTGSESEAMTIIKMALNNAKDIGDTTIPSKQ